ncbi:hypothetical protein CIB48_g8476 [Xylaria polymorpha]|nr:hypothetical protein CIB48_g8476 [Xylaria polymorpha]
MPRRVPRVASLANTRPSRSSVFEQPGTGARERSGWIASHASPTPKALARYRDGEVSPEAEAIPPEPAAGQDAACYVISSMFLAPRCRAGSPHWSRTGAAGSGQSHSKDSKGGGVYTRFHVRGCPAAIIIQ